QVAYALASHFARIIATDASAEQVAQAVPHERVSYQVAPAEQSPLDDNIADLVTVAQALHWFDVKRFYAEATRVLKPGGLLAVWTYDHLRADAVLDAVVRRYADEVVGPYWPPERRFVDARYQTFSFPFPEEQPPVFDMTQTWTLDDLLGYLSTWSATRRFMKTHGTNPLDEVREELSRVWGVAEDEKIIRWPLHLRVGRHRA
ncbi:MAG TPA: class I SAM-dependent methyltransferase, partial [Rhodothermales bacterium]|nr:class I SAM-dependent methyltransferase [Rhodothermales bacterium]